MLRLHPILLAIGAMLTFLGIAMLPSALLDYIDNHARWSIFALSGFGAIFIGTTILASVGMKQNRAGTHEAFLLTVLIWILLPIIAALPFIGFGYSLTDAFFESMSGLTTTGATVITGLDDLPRGLLLWRAILQWFGGIGIIVTAIAILPMLRVGGMQLFSLESSHMSGKFLPRVTEIASQTGMVYLGLSVLCAWLYYISGMSGFDAIAHAMTTMAAGGFSTHDASFAYFNGTAAINIAIVFMILAALPFGIFVMALHGKLGSMRTDPQIRTFMLILTFAIVVLSGYLSYTQMIPETNGFWVKIQAIIFNTVAVMTGTGYANADYSLWGGFAQTTMFILIFCGGCAGSAACGMKMFRIEIAFKALGVYIRRMVRPDRITHIYYANRVVDNEDLQSVMVFIFVYLATFFITTILLSLFGLDMITALSGAASMVSNVGPGLGEMIGPSGNYQSFPDAAKWICAVAMLLGRLEFIAVFVVLMPRFWRG